MARGISVLKLASGPLVSVIMPTYNHGAFIADAIDSVFAQTYANWELIIVNNFSADNTEAVLARYSDPRIRVEKFSNGGIIAKSRNRGLSLAKGDYLALLDSDDAWEPEKLAAQVDIMERRGYLLLCSTALSFFPRGLRSPLIRKWNRVLSISGLKTRNLVYNSSVLLRRSCLETIGFFDEEPALRTVEDYEYWLRIAQYRDKSVFFIDNPLLRYRVSDCNASGIGRKVDAGAEFAKYRCLGEKRFSGKELTRFLRSKRSEIAWRCLEFGCVDKAMCPPARDILLRDRCRLFISGAVKKTIKKLQR